MNNDIATAAANAAIDTVPAVRGTQYRATYAVGGGGAVLGYGADADAARADLVATLEFNVAANGRIF